MAKRRYKYDDRITLEGLFEDAKDFSLVLPHFQRDFVWKADDQRSLLQSMLAGIPIGSILLLEDDKESYSSRPLCFRDFKPKIKKDKCTFLLDGQQRISTLKSIFCDLFSEEEVKKLQKKNWEDLYKDLPSQLRYRWFLKIDSDNEGGNDIWGIKDLNFKETHGDDKPFSPADFLEYVKYERVHKTKKEAYHPESSEVDLKNWAVSKKLVPLYFLGDINSILFEEILSGIARNEHIIKKRLKSTEEEYKKKKRDIKTWVKKVISFLESRTLKTSIPSITLEGPTGMEIGIYIFEQVNRGGVKLDIYDLLVARMALISQNGKNLNLTNEIEKLCKQTQSINSAIYNGEKDGFEARSMGIWNEKDNIPEKIFKKAFKNCLAICNKKNKDGLDNLSDKYIKENYLLDLTAEEIYENWEETVKTLFSVLQFLHFRCGVVKLNDIPYELLIVPLFVFFIKHENKPIKEDVDKIEFWYWVSIFCGHYREKQSTRVIEDSKMIIKIQDFHKEFHDRSDRIFQEEGYSDKESLTRERAYSRQPQLDRAINQYVLSKEPWDLKQTKPRTQLSAYYFAKENNGLEKNLHHIIPLNEIAGKGNKKVAELRKDKEHPINSALNKVFISQEANWKIQRVSDYSNNQNQLNCDRNMIPVPTDKEFMKKDKPYKLNEFLSARFLKIKENVEERSDELIVAPPEKSK